MEEISEAFKAHLQQYIDSIHFENTGGDTPDAFREKLEQFQVVMDGFAETANAKANGYLNDPSLTFDKEELKGQLIAIAREYQAKIPDPYSSL